MRWYEQLGFTSIHWSDHVMLQGWDPIAGEAAVAATTSTAAVGSTVLDTGFYQPIVLARAAATIAAIAGGGYELGLGAGWSADDYEMAGMHFAGAGERLAHLEEAIQVIKSLWANPTTDFTGDHLQIREAPSVLKLPLPVQPKVLVGGTMPKAIGVAGRHADIVSVFSSVVSGKIGWDGWAAGSTIEEFTQKIEWAREAARAIGRDPDSFECSTQLTHLAVADDPAPLQDALHMATEVSPADQDEAMIFLTGTPEQAREKLKLRRDKTGISYYVVQDPAWNYAHPEQPPTLPGDSGDGASDRYLEYFAEQIVQELSGS